ncbi:MAG: hypothetical protein IJK42_14510 [Prevotella sp.]|nr:hypothetical protein [Prevotella sp.]MBQ6210959.1 hypothetical protein [Prevotella sp.]
MEATHPNYDRLMKGLDWGRLYETYHNHTDWDTDWLQQELERLWMDDDVTHKAGAYSMYWAETSEC